jgi:hypothetical protein
VLVGVRLDVTVPTRGVGVRAGAGGATDLLEGGDVGLRWLVAVRGQRVSSCALVNVSCRERRKSEALEKGSSARGELRRGLKPLNVAPGAQKHGPKRRVSSRREERERANREETHPSRYDLSERCFSSCAWQALGKASR